MTIYHTVYQLTNLVNGKIYIGCHMTKDVNDGYMGSGKRLAYAKKKHGEENFKKDILKICESEAEMLTEEARLVNEEFLGRPDVYNLTLGGGGGWFAVNKDPINQRKNLQSEKFKRYHSGPSKQTLEKAKAVMWIKYKNDFEFYLRVKAQLSRNGTKAIKHAAQFCSTPEAIQKRKDKFAKIGHQQGEKNSQFGKVWMYDETRSLRFKKEEVEQKLSEGWKLGRKMLRKVGSMVEKQP